MEAGPEPAAAAGADLVRKYRCFVTCNGKNEENEGIMAKTDKNVQDAPERPAISRHAIILARDGRALAAHQGGKTDPKTELFNLREYHQDDLHFPQ